MNVCGIGRMVTDAVVRTGDGWECAKFRLAIESKRKPKEGEEKQTLFASCESFGSTGKFIEKWFKKGARIYIVGNLEPNVWVDKEDKKHNDFRIIVTEADFVDSKADREALERKSNYEPKSDADDTSLPFDI